jgi:hypothetical protein
MFPKKKITKQDGQTLASWPRGVVTIGSSKEDDMRSGDN